LSIVDAQREIDISARYAWIFTKLKIMNIAKSTQKPIDKFYMLIPANQADNLVLALV